MKTVKEELEQAGKEIGEQFGPIFTREWFSEWFHGPRCLTKEELDNKNTPELNQWYDDLIGDIKKQKESGEFIPGGPIVSVLIPETPKISPYTEISVICFGMLAIYAIIFCLIKFPPF